GREGPVWHSSGVKCRDSTWRTVALPPAPSIGQTGSLRKDTHSRRSWVTPASAPCAASAPDSTAPQPRSPRAGLKRDSEPKAFCWHQIIAATMQDLLAGSEVHMKWDQ